MTLDSLPIGTSARIASVDWARVAEADAKRLRALGLDEGCELAVAHRGIFGGRDPLAITVGRMTVALRRRDAAAISVIAL
ncbi:MAG: FeoA family protein [Parerythrobacter sp.]